MTKADILAELPKLSSEDLAEIHARLKELVGNEWVDGGELSEEDKRVLDEELAEYEKSPDAGSSLDEVMARVHAKLREGRPRRREFGDRAEAESRRTS